MEIARIGNCQSWKLSELEFVRIGNCQNRNWSELEFVGIGKNPIWGPKCYVWKGDLMLRSKLDFKYHQKLLRKNYAQLLIQHVLNF